MMSRKEREPLLPQRDLFVAETSASTTTAILEQDVNLQHTQNTWIKLLNPLTTPGHRCCLAPATNASDMHFEVPPSLPPPPNTPPYPPPPNTPSPVPTPCF